MASSTRTTSSRSRASTAKSDLFLQQKIKKETAKKKIEYVQKESELVCQRAKIEADALIQKAKIETQLMRIKAEEDTEVAEISMKILEEEFQDICNCSDNGSEFGDWIASHTKRYVENSHIEADRLLTPEPAIPPIRTPFVGTRPEFPNTVTPPPSPPTPAAPPDSILNPCARLFVPENFVSQSSACEPNKQSGINQALMDMTNFLTKKSFILERVKPFVGDSESYLAWKSTFQEVMKEIDASPSIELDLMIKNLEGKPYEQVKSIKNSNTGDSTLGVQKAWERLDSFYGSPDRIARALKRKLSDVLEKFDFNNRPDYFCLSDTLNEINAVKDNPKYSKTLSYFDTSDGVKPVLLKLPIHVQNKWRDKAIQYKKNNDVEYPPFCVFCTFVQEMAYVMNDPGFDFECKPIHLAPKTKSNKQFHRQTDTSNKTDVLQDESQAKVRCAVHNSAHSTSDCNVFRTKSIGEKRNILRKHGQCFKCCDGKHLSNDCRVKVKCDTCGSRHHCTAMHFDTSNRPSQNHGGEKLTVTGEKPAFHRQTAETTTHLNAACTEICGDFRGKSCAKIVLVSIHHKHSEHPPVNVYAILDEQSNKSLAKPELFEMFDPNSTCESYKLSTCSGSSLVSGRRSHGFVINSMDRQTTFSLPTLIECSAIPNNRHEIPTCDVAIHHPHLAQISSFIPPMDHTANISLLIGRDLLGAHYVLDQIRGDPSQPYAQRLPLGWVVIGETCLDGIHTPKSVDVMKTMCSNSEQPSQGIWIPCDQKMHITECIENQSVFRRTTTDNQPSLSVEDRLFLTQMVSDMKKDSSGHWSAPLPFKRTRPTLPNNRQQALDRAVSLDKSLMKNPLKKTHFLEFMRNLFEAGHIELEPQLPPNTECWYLPLFGVYHPQKRDKIRGVFDSSAKCDGVLLNDVLMTGPDLMNNLIGVLLRFRRESVAIVADIEQMFYSFLVDIEHRRYLRFIWHKENNFDEPLVDYQMKVHVFGNSPSPAVATYGLRRRTADEAAAQYGSDMREFVHRNFYVEDALSSHSSAEDEIDLLKRTQKALMEHGCLRLHKIASNSGEVLAAFSSQDLAKDLKDTELWADDLPTQRSLGICWNLQHDYFTFKVNMEDKPFTRRGVLSSINSLFDPLGFVAPVTIAGKAILREAMTSGLDWDEPLPPDFLQKWTIWKSSLKDLEHLQIPRTFSEMSVSKANYKELLIFSDASTMAIAAVAFLRQVSDTGKEQLGFIMGKAKLAPKHGHTVPRLELCAAVMATALYELIAAEIDTNLDSDFLQTVK
ncbi:uncharacterized protein LOC134264140 [Saccostrea cucullata]|uniref:uncharacterized protein LOC134264140 n=1 Tax=Saccostrea cuccullata TaxID=36930 RepID=UPI002ED42C99